MQTVNPRVSQLPNCQLRTRSGSGEPALPHDHGPEYPAHVLYFALYGDAFEFQLPKCFLKQHAFWSRHANPLKGEYL
jgi:hypothetical protein